MYGGIGAVCSGLSLISGRGAPLHPNLSSCAIRRAPECFCFGCRAQRCRGHLTGGEEAGDRRRLGDASPPTSPTSDLQRGVWGNFPRYNPEIVSRQKVKGSREAPPFAPVSCLHPSCKTPAAAAPPQSADAAHLCHPNLSSRATRARPNIFATYHHRSHRAIYARRLVYNGKEKRNEDLRQKTRNAPERTQKPGRFIWPETQTLRPLERVRSEVS